MRDIFSGTPNFDFLGKQRIFFAISLLLMMAAVGVWFQKGESKFGIDFVGGHELVVEIPAAAQKEKVSVEKLLTIFESSGMKGLTIKGYGSANSQYSVRLQGLEDTNKSEPQTLPSDVSLGNDGLAKTESSRVQLAVTEVLKKAGFVDSKVVSAEFIGPTVGAELRSKALLAVLIGLVGILAYLAFRFELAFGIGAVVALAHDVIFSLGVYLLLGYTINMETLAAALTIVGYSVNDTIVIFDRVREEIYEEKPGTLSEIVNRAVNAMLSRTVVTHMLTTISMLALLIFGSGAIEDMSVFLLAGMVSGSYSTMYIAAPIMIAWHKFRGGSEEV
jgi:preprotein translocase SecF subunit